MANTRTNNEDIENCVNCEAENVGCNYISKALSQKINEALEASSHE